MTTVLAFFFPAIFLLTFLAAFFKKVKVYDSFTEGVKGAIPLILSVFPYIAAVTMLSKLLEISGLGEKITHFLSPVFSFTGIPQEIAPLVLIKPLSGSGSIAVLSDILERYGVDSYPARCACASTSAKSEPFVCMVSRIRLVVPLTMPNRE